MSRLCIAAVALLAFLAVSASAAPCIECKDCKTNNCFSQCKATCPVTVNGEECKRVGRDYGKRAAADACKTTETFCNGGKPPVTTRTLGQVTLGQCANIAYGSCQQVALDPKQSPCGRNFNGFRQCNGKEFMDFYKGEINEYCYRLASAIAPTSG